MTSGQGFTYIKTSFMDLLEPGQPSQDYLQSRYGLILEQQFCENNQTLLDLLQVRFPDIEVSERFIDYIDEPRLLLTDGRNLIFSLVERTIFQDIDAKLILLKLGEFELIQQGEQFRLGFKRYCYAEIDGYENKTQIVTAEQVKQWQVQGLQAVKDYVQSLRLSSWRYQPIWLAVCKAKLESACFNMAIDGSDFYVFYSCIPADSSEEAEQKLIQHLDENYLSADPLYSIRPFIKDEFKQQSDFSIDLLDSFSNAYLKQQIHSFISPPYGMTSFLIAPCATIISKWHCDNEFWSKRTKEIERCEFFPNANLCFERLVELNKLTQADYDEFIHLDDGEGLEPIHYRLLPEGNKRFEKIQRSFEADGDLMIDWEDWHYDFYKKGEDYFLWIYVGGIADKTIEIKLADYQVARYEREGMSYIHELIRKV